MNRRREKCGKSSLWVRHSVTDSMVLVLCWPTSVFGFPLCHLFMFDLRGLNASFSSLAITVAPSYIPHFSFLPSIPLPHRRKYTLGLGTCADVERGEICNFAVTHLSSKAKRLHNRVYMWWRSSSFLTVMVFRVLKSSSCLLTYVPPLKLKQHRLEAILLYLVCECW